MIPELQMLVHNWLRKADSDLKIGSGELHTSEPATDMVCFHMQQCVERLLKAFLSLHQRRFRRTHDIAELIELCKEIRPAFDSLYGLQADWLTVFGVEIRYPDDFYVPTLDEANTALRIVSSVREFVYAQLSASGWEDSSVAAPRPDQAA